MSPAPPPAAPSDGVARVPPNNPDAEEGLLGCILADAERTLDLCASQGIRPECFYSPARRWIYQVAVEMHEQGQPVDLLTMSARLRELDLSDKIGDDVYLHALLDRTPTAEHAPYHLDALRGAYLLRMLHQRALRVAELCAEKGADAREVLGAAEQEILEVRNHDRPERAAWPDQVDDVSSEIARIIAAHGLHLTGISTGFRALDDILCGLQPGELIVLAARPSMGKTSLAMNIAENVATGYNPISRVGGPDRRPRAVAVFSLEMSSAALVRRMLCSRAGVAWRRIVAGLCARDEERRLYQAATELKSVRIFIDDTAGLEVSELRGRARRLQRLHQIELIVIDYLQLLACRGLDPNNRAVMVQAISASLKAMAKELKVPVLVLSQLNRQPETRERHGVPQLADLRDSGAIEQDADVVMLLRLPIRNKIGEDPRRKDAAINPGLAVVDVAKQRNGRTGEVDLYFDDSLTRFSDMLTDQTDGGVLIRPSEGGVED